MTAQLAFQILNFSALVLWIILIFFYQSKTYRLLISSGFAFILFGLVYIVLLIMNLETDPTAFSSLENLKSLYSDPWLILLGWVHYLAFDLLAGVWIKSDSLNFGIHQKLIIIPLIFTFMTGPFGLLLYLIIKYVYVRNTRVTIGEVQDRKTR
ncbi:MAG: ABA4-like family protein [Bacteroidota bacterium]